MADAPRLSATATTGATNGKVRAAGPGAANRNDAASPNGVRPGHIPTMRDIADAAGVSQSTVSRVLTGAPNAIPINPATRDRIIEVARRMRYRPNPLARGLRGARTMLLGVIVREITDPFFAGAVDAISTEANLRGYNVVLVHAHGRTDEAIALRAVLETWRSCATPRSRSLACGRARRQCPGSRSSPSTTGPASTA
jgi:transcriptional regulator with XRE-family HTH domain